MNKNFNYVDGSIVNITATYGAQASVSCSFVVDEAFSEAEAEDAARGCFSLEEISLEIQPLYPQATVRDRWCVRAFYSVSASSIGEAKDFHDRVFNGTPRWRRAMADISRIEALPPLVLR